MIDRGRLKKRIKNGLAQFPVVLLVGPRQCGKTTIAKQIATEYHADYYDLEDPSTIVILLITLLGLEIVLIKDIKFLF